MKAAQSEHHESFCLDVTFRMEPLTYENVVRTWSQLIAVRRDGAYRRPVRTALPLLDRICEFVSELPKRSKSLNVQTTRLLRSTSIN